MSWLADQSEMFVVMSLLILALTRLRAQVHASAPGSRPNPWARRTLHRDNTVMQMPQLAFVHAPTPRLTP